MKFRDRDKLVVGIAAGKKGRELNNLAIKDKESIHILKIVPRELLPTMSNLKF